MITINKTMALNLWKIENIEVIWPVYIDKWGDKGLLNVLNIVFN